MTAGNLTLSTLQELSPPGKMLTLGGGGRVTAYRNFSPSPVLGGSGVNLYFSALITCTLLPTNSQNIASLLVSGSSNSNGSDDPLGLYATSNSSGYTFRITEHGESATAQKFCPLGPPT